MSTAFSISTLPMPRSEAEAKARYKAARARLFGVPEKTVSKPIPPKRVIMRLPADFIKAPTWTRQSCSFDQHVTRHREFIGDTDKHRAKRYAAFTAWEHGLSFCDLQRLGRDQKIVPVRHSIIWHIVCKWPDISYSEIGRMFNRDSSTILYAAKRYAEKMGLHLASRHSGPVKIADETACRIIRRGLKKRLTIAEISREIGASPTFVISVADRNGIQLPRAYEKQNLYAGLDMFEMRNDVYSRRPYNSIMAKFKIGKRRMKRIREEQGWP